MYDSLHIVPPPPRVPRVSFPIPCPPVGPFSPFTMSRATPALSPLRRATSLAIVFPCRFSPLCFQALLLVSLITAIAVVRRFLCDRVRAISTLHRALARALQINRTANNVARHIVTTVEWLNASRSHCIRSKAYIRVLLKKKSGDEQFITVLRCN